MQFCCVEGAEEHSPGAQLLVVAIFRFLSELCMSLSISVGYLRGGWKDGIQAQETGG